jgi:hypothetical protein
MNHIQVDAQKFYQVLVFFSSMAAFPITTIIGLYMLYNLVHIAAIPGFLAIFLLTYFNYRLAKSFYK